MTVPDPAAPATTAGRALFRELSEQWGKPAERLSREQILAIEREAADAAVARAEDAIERLPVGFSHVQAVIAVRSAVLHADTKAGFK